MRAVKIAAYVAAGLVGLVIVALLLIVLFVDPNDYRDDIERIVEQKTGRELALDGELKLSVFPWLALETGPASLGEAPGFGDEPFVSIQGARVSARLLPLLRGKLEVGTVRLSGARIRLITDEQGRTNWSDLGSQDEAQAPTGDTTPAELPTIAGLQIEDAAITIENRQDDTRRVVRDFDLETGRLRSGEPFDLTTAFVLDQDSTLSVNVHLAATVTADLERNAHRLAEPEIAITLSGSGYPAEGVPVQIRANLLEADIGQERYRLDGLTATTTWKSDGLPAQGVPVSLSAQALGANLAAQTLELTGLDLTLAGARLSGALNGVEILDAPRLEGPLGLEPLSPREWLPKLGIELPPTKDPEVFKRLAFSGKVALTKSSADIRDIMLQLDDTTAKGTVGVADFDAKALRFDLNVDRIDADRYLAPAEEGAADAGAEEPPTQIGRASCRERVSTIV